MTTRQRAQIIALKREAPEASTRDIAEWVGGVSHVSVWTVLKQAGLIPAKK